MKKLLSGSYYFAILIGLIFTICGFLFAGNETSFRKGEVAGKQTITPQSVEQIDKMTKEYIFWVMISDRKTLRLCSIRYICALRCMKMERRFMK